MLSLISNVYAADPAPAPQGADFVSLLFPILLLVVFYFLLIRPQQKRAKEHKALVDQLKVGDSVMTTGGMVGKISKLGDNFADLDTGNTKITIQRQSIAGLMPKDALKDY